MPLDSSFSGFTSPGDYQSALNIASGRQDPVGFQELLRDNPFAQRQLDEKLANQQAQLARQQLGEERRQFDAQFARQGDLLQQILGGFGVSTGGGGGVPGLSRPGGPDSPGAPGNIGGGGAGSGNSLLAQLVNFGAGERARINQEFQNLGNTSLARLEHRGLGGSTLGNSALAGVERQRQQAIGDLSDRTINTSLGIQERDKDRQVELVKALTGIFGAL